MSENDTAFDARLSRIEGTVEQMDKRLGDVTERIASVDRRMEDRFDAVDRQFGEMDAKVDGRFSEMDAKIDRRSAETDAKIDSVRSDMRRWIYVLVATVGVVVTIATSVVQVLL